VVGYGDSGLTVSDVDDYAADDVGGFEVSFD
jgi:hypothetical protein